MCLHLDLWRMQWGILMVYECFLSSSSSLREWWWNSTIGEMMHSSSGIAFTNLEWSVWTHPFKTACIPSGMVRETPESGGFSVWLFPWDTVASNCLQFFVMLIGKVSRHCSTDVGSSTPKPLSLIKNLKVGNFQPCKHLVMCQILVTMSNHLHTQEYCARGRFCLWIKWQVGQSHGN